MNEYQKVISITKNNVHVTKSSEISILAISIPLIHISNFSSKISLSNTFKIEVSISFTTSFSKVESSSKFRFLIFILFNDSEEK